MMTTATAKLTWGLQPPSGTTVAWGARAISEPDGELDLLWDRQSAVGSKADKQRLQGALDRLLPCARTEWRRLWARGKVRSDEPRRVVLVNDGEWTIEADTCASFGYVYLVAFRHPAERAWGKLCARLPSGEQLRAKLDGESYVLYGSPTGEHSLCVSVTPPERLAAHFAGYVSAALRAAKVAATEQRS